MQRSPLVVRYATALALKELPTLVTFEGAQISRIRHVERSFTLCTVWIVKVITQAGMPDDLVQKKTAERSEKGHWILLYMSNT
jgi:hypothetical protein